MMKVTVSFGQTGIVVPCKEGWTVRDLIQQATQRYKKLLEQEGEFLVRTHHLEYCDGGILDPDDTLSDLVEDRDKLMAVYEEQEAQRTTPDPGVSPSPELYHSELSVFQPITGGEIEVTSSALKSNTPLLVRSSSDSALNPPSTESGPSLPEDPTPMIAGPAVPATDRFYNKHAFNTSLTRMVEILGEDSPLGIHVVPYCSSLSGRPLGLFIRGIEEDSRSRREGLFVEDECIVKINTSDLMDKSFSQAQEIFRQAMRSPTVRLEVVSASNRERYEKSLIGQLFNSTTGSEGSPRVPKSKDPPPPVKAKPVFRPQDSTTMRIPEDVAPACAPRSRSQSPHSRKSPGLSSLVSGKRGGRRLRIDLKKGSEGLGFTVVTRDSSVHGPGPILVKNILPRGAAVKDGRLQSGDRILEVNGVDITGVGQEELVTMLRSTRQGESVSLVILRQEDMFLPREMKEEVPHGPYFISESGKEQLMFEIPLNDTGSAGLGVSLKGNKSRETGEDLGIFVKSIIHGGAAYKDGRLHVNDQLVAVNGESLLGRSNHDAMETLRRSMSQEGNVRGTIQLVILRVLLDHSRVSPNRSFDSSSGLRMSPVDGQTNGMFHPAMVNDVLYGSHVTNGSYTHMDEEEDGEMYGQETSFSSSVQQNAYLHESFRDNLNQVLAQNPNPRQFVHVKASKSMDLVEDESNIGSMSENTAASPTPMELGPTLGLKKSSSLESLQTAMSEVKRRSDLLPFHRPRANMVRGRGCNESFRAAIDKSYDGPPEDDDGDPSEPSSGRETPNSSSRPGTVDQMDNKNKKDKKKKDKPKKKEKMPKPKEKKKTEEPEEFEKKGKKIWLLRFGKKKDEKKESKATLQRQKSDLLSDVELEKMKEERERIESNHPELRPRDPLLAPAPSYPDVEDDDMDPNYARIQTFRDRTAPSPSQPLSQAPHYSSTQHPSARTPSPHTPAAFTGHGSNGMDPPSALDDNQIDRIYAKVNKQRGAGAAAPAAPGSANDGVDRIQQLRREYQQACREGMVPPYEDLDQRRRAHDNDPQRMGGRDPRMVPRYEEVERQYASLPRRGPQDPSEYPIQTQQPWSGHYPGPPQNHQAYSQSPSYPNHNVNPQTPAYPNHSANSSGPYSYTGGPAYTRDPRTVEPRYYPIPSSQQRGPLRQDVPPSPTPPMRGLRYDTMTRGAVGGGYR
ncbi:partitioning defective 3 homolog B isoform X2 [Periophthalmus magnuspinnatus]|uniref:partitioning defective 3 homolog B isoform X2 n=1 Tax=Periophthalmus magnuspinnatus TaxID=409849 RepID=UPI00145B3C34|nr:partitioning defective 3 homolog B isoform X2 [Periophthalmus magnuspinnatus]